jgi:hypothetical protein
VSGDAETPGETVEGVVSGDAETPGETVEGVVSGNGKESGEDVVSGSMIKPHRSNAVTEENCSCN